MKTLPVRNFMGLYDELLPDYDKCQFVVIPAPYEFTTTQDKGTRYGPAAIIDASHHVEFYDDELKIQTVKETGIFTTVPPNETNERPEKFLPNLERAVECVLKDGKFPFVLGGEHSITEGPVKAVAAKYKNLSILHFDAHCDLRKSYHGSKFNHACAAHRMMQFAKVVQVGIRSVSEDEYQYCNTDKVRTYLMCENRNIGQLIPKVLKDLTDTVYITIDIDGLDPSIAPGTGTPVPGGLLWYDVLEILRATCRAKTVVGADVTEVRPISGNSITECLGAKLVYRLMGYVHVFGKKAENHSQKKLVTRK